MCTKSIGIDVGVKAGGGRGVGVVLPRFPIKGREEKSPKGNSRTRGSGGSSFLSFLACTNSRTKYVSAAPYSHC